MRCLSFNARSIVTKMSDLFYVVDVLRPDIVGITETWADDTVSDAELGIAGFDLYRKDRGNGRRGGGVALYVKSCLQSTGFSLKTEFPEHVWCQIPNHGGPDLLVGVCYKTPTADVFAVDLDGLLRRLIHEVSHRHLLLMGDFNYGDIDWSSPGAEPATEASKLFLDCLDDCFLTRST